ncbi:hypothetical protein VNI00_019359 [Paramarasmius palmivorus]|uniref:Uncharacterized protein n=1 Tax=Paramarasmius palmivorus TaxID=297713 RepID=A0AAW0AP53_9AGAR
MDTPDISVELAPAQTVNSVTSTINGLAEGSLCMEDLDALDSFTEEEMATLITQNEVEQAVHRDSNRLFPPAGTSASQEETVEEDTELAEEFEKGFGFSEESDKEEQDLEKEQEQDKEDSEQESEADTDKPVSEEDKGTPAEEEKDDQPESPSIGPKPKPRTPSPKRPPPKEESFDSDEEEDNMSKAVKAFNDCTKLKDDGSNWGMWAMRVELAAKSIGYGKYLTTAEEGDADADNTT